MKTHRQRRPFIGILFLAGCTTTAPVVVHAPPGYDLGPAWQAALDAKLPVRLERVHHGVTKVEHTGENGTVVIWVTTEDLKGQAGHAHWKLCKPIGEVEHVSAPAVFVHEVGHLLWLQHSPDAPHSVMAPFPKSELTTEQRYFMQAGAQILKICRKVRR